MKSIQLILILFSLPCGVAASTSLDAFYEVIIESKLIPQEIKDVLPDKLPSSVQSYDLSSSDEGEVVFMVLQFMIDQSKIHGHGKTEFLKKIEEKFKSKIGRLIPTISLSADATYAEFYNFKTGFLVSSYFFIKSKR
jgi:hypothetical protein